MNIKKEGIPQIEPKPYEGFMEDINRMIRLPYLAQINSSRGHMFGLPMSEAILTNPRPINEEEKKVIEELREFANKEFIKEWTPPSGYISFSQAKKMFPGYGDSLISKEER